MMADLWRVGIFKLKEVEALVTDGDSSRANDGVYWATTNPQQVTKPNLNIAL